MNKPLLLPLTGLFLALLASPGSALARDTAALARQLEADTRALTSEPHRLSGTPEYARAVEYVLSRLGALGYGEDAIMVQEFPNFQSLSARDEDGNRQVYVEFDDGARLPLYPMRPNATIPPTTPKAGVQGEFVYAGDGALGSFPETPDGKIVILDFDSGHNWRRAFRMGARAVIFVPGNNPEFSNRSSHHTSAPAGFFRYYYDGPVSDLLEAGSGTIHASVLWRGVRVEKGPDGTPERAGIGRNILVFIDGNDPVVNKDASTPIEETVLLAAPLDSFGQVPELSPGANNAANVAALLSMAEYLRDNPPRRNVVLAFFDNKARAHRGAVAFYRSLVDRNNDAHYTEREDSLENERIYVDLLDGALKYDDPVGRKVIEDPDLGQNAVTEVRVLLRRISNEGLANSREAEARYNLLRERRREDGRDLTAEEKEKLERIQYERASWNDFKEGLENDGIGPDFFDETKMEFAFNESIATVRTYVANAREEVALKEQVIETEKRIRERLSTNGLVLHTSLMLGDATPKWGLLLGGESSLRSLKDTGSLYVTVMDTFAEAVRDLRAGGLTLDNFVEATTENLISPPHLFFAGSGFSHSGDIAGHLAVENIALSTSQEAFRHEGTPAETADAIDFTNLANQLAEVRPVLAAVIDHDKLSGQSSIEKRDDFEIATMDGSFNWNGPVLRARSLGSSTADTPVAGGMITIRTRQSNTKQFAAYDFKPDPIPAFDDFIIERSNAAGAFGWGPFETEPRRLTVFAVDFDERGFVAYANDTQSSQGARGIQAMYPARHGALVLPPQPLADIAQIYEALTNSPLSLRESFSQTVDGCVLWFCEQDIEGVKVFSEESVFALNIPEKVLDAGNELGDEVIYGNGILFRDEDGAFFPPHTSLRSAYDISRLNDIRLDILRKRNISKSSVDQLHAENRDLLKSAEAAAGNPGGGDADEKEALAAASWLKERRVYEDTRSSMEDLVTAVIFLLLLNIPFAFAAERLLIGSPNIYRQTGFFALFFLGTFVLLYFTHPAFAIAATPVIIFLGFAIVLLSGLVIFIIMQKFEVELKALQGIAGTVHSADVSRFNTVLAAMNMGISTMRRRPLRTALTAATVILLTFTILCFASFGREVGVVRIFEEGTPGYTGVNFHRVSWGQIPDDMAELSRTRWEDKEGVTAVAPRVWIVPERASAERPAINPGVLATDASASRLTVLRGVLGLDIADARLRPAIAELLGNRLEAFDSTIWVTEPVANQLGASPGDTVLMGGKELTLGPLLDPSRMLNLTDMDGSSILPVNLDDPEIAQQAQSEGSENTVSSQSWENLLVDTIAIVSNNVAEELGGTMRALNIYTYDVRTATEVAEEMAAMTNMPVNATRSDGVYRHVFGAVLQASGLRDLFFPVLLGGLVIFGTMLGSVADREKEIYTFSALGLAPPHVTGLFFAEALVYSVIGGMGGYLFAQGVLALLTWLAQFGLITVPQINYSSTNAIMTIFIVMLTVLVSAVFPAIKASRSANPGVMRNWRLPQPKGDELDITFPFTVSEYDITGVVSFLKEHFDAYKDTGMGSFMSRDTDFFSPEKGSVGLRSRLALAPFDLGVTQDFRLYSAPSQIPGIDEVRIQITRLSGQPKDWARLNKVLMDDLRKQFLIWRSLPRETMESYRMRTLQELGREQEATATA